MIRFERHFLLTILALSVVWPSSCGKTMKVKRFMRYDASARSYILCDSPWRDCDTITELRDDGPQVWYRIGGEFVPGPSLGTYSVVGGKWGLLRELPTDSAEVRILTEPVFDAMQVFSEGLAAVQTGGQWGFVDTGGHMAIAAQYDTAGWSSKWHGLFLDGMAWVSKDGKSFRINKLGQHTGSGTYEIDARQVFQRVTKTTGMDPFDARFRIGGMMTWFKEQGRWGILDEQESVLVKPAFAKPATFRPFRDTLVWVWGDSAIGLWKKDGGWVLPPRFDIVRVFPAHTWVNIGGQSRGYDPLSGYIVEGGKWGLVDSTGAIVIEPGKERVEFGDRQVPVKVNGRWMYRWKGKYQEGPGSELDDILKNIQGLGSP